MYGNPLDRERDILRRAAACETQDAREAAWGEYRDNFIGTAALRHMRGEFDRYIKEHDMRQITESRAREILNHLDDQGANIALPFQDMALLRDAATAQHTLFVHSVLA